MAPPPSPEKKKEKKERKNTAVFIQKRLKCILPIQVCGHSLLCADFIEQKKKKQQTKQKTTTTKSIAVI